jgi:hypothetical protein
MVTSSITTSAPKQDWFWLKELDAPVEVARAVPPSPLAAAAAVAEDEPLPLVLLLHEPEAGEGPSGSQIGKAPVAWSITDARNVLPSAVATAISGNTPTNKSQLAVFSRKGFSSVVES